MLRRGFDEVIWEKNYLAILLPCTPFLTPSPIIRYISQLSSLWKHWSTPQGTSEGLTLCRSFCVKTLPLTLYQPCPCPMSLPHILHTYIGDNFWYYHLQVLLLFFALAKPHYMKSKGAKTYMCHSCQPHHTQKKKVTLMIPRPEFCQETNWVPLSLSDNVVFAVKVTFLRWNL